MFIDQFYSEDGNKVAFSRQQSSDFAKHVADDFNPLHDIDSTSFCVPGDLLFSYLLSKYGVNKHMALTFTGMVTDGVYLNLPPSQPILTFTDDDNREYLTIEREGGNSTCTTLVDNLTRSYAAFSGQAFPHIITPLLEELGVMINPKRPMVIYQRTVIDLDQLDRHDITLELNKNKTKVEASGKHGNICLAFDLLADNKIIGRGEKHMVVASLKPFEKEAAYALVEGYNNLKETYKKNQG